MSIRIQTERKGLQATYLTGRWSGAYSVLAVCIPSDISIWPPTVLFDAVCASAVPNHFGFAVMDISEK